MVLAGLAGAYLLRTSSRDAGTSAGFYHARGAASATEAGVRQGISQLETDPDLGLKTLKDYDQDGSKKWLLGASGATSSANAVNLSVSGQSYTANIVGFNKTTRLIKVESQGAGPLSAAAKAASFYRLDGVETPFSVPPVDYALYIGGDDNARVTSAPLVVTGATFFAGGLQLDKDGSDFIGKFKAGAYGSKPFKFKGSATFREAAYFETPVEFQAGAKFEKDVAFDDDLQINNFDVSLTGAQPQKFYANGAIKGTAKIDMNQEAFVHSGIAGTANITDQASSTSARTIIDLPRSMGFNPGMEASLKVDWTSIPGTKPYGLDELNNAFKAKYGYYMDYSQLTAKDLVLAFHAINGTRQIGFPRPAKNYSLYVPIIIDKPVTMKGGDADANMNYVDNGVNHDDDENFKWFVFKVANKLTVNGNMWWSTKPGWGTHKDDYGTALFYVGDGGELVDFGGNYEFRGYVYVTGTGKASYKWGPNGKLTGAVHHVSPASTFAVHGTNAMKVTWNSGIIDQLALHAGLITEPSYTAPGTAPQLADTRIRPLFLGTYR